MVAPKHIVITGASSGLGAALALHYAKAGAALSLMGRDEQRLEGVAAQCRAHGAEVFTAALDVRDQGTMEEWLQHRDDERWVDLVIANAGVSAGTGGDIGESFEQVKHIFDVNFYGVMHSIYPFLGRMKSRGQGQIALMSSFAGYRGWPGAPAYCGSKAAVKVYGEALRGAMRDHGVHISVVCPGFIRTPMTDVNGFAMPFMMAPDRAAAIIAKGLLRNKGRISFPWPMSLVMWFVGLCPDAVLQFFAKFSPRKPSQDA